MRRRIMLDEPAGDKGPLLAWIERIGWGLFSVGAAVLLILTIAAAVMLFIGR